MKRSKIFLGVTTALLAIAGVAAAKHYSGSRTAYFVTHGQTWCTSVLIGCTQTGTTDCQYTTTGPLQKKVTLYTLGPVGTYSTTNPANCINKVTYIGTN